jgi:hypothetical protein
VLSRVNPGQYQSNHYCANTAVTVCRFLDHSGSISSLVILFFSTSISCFITMSTSVSEEPAHHPVKRALAPWKLTAEVYMLFLTLKELPKNVHDELEGEVGGWDDEEKGTFKGGLGSVVVVR